MFTHGGHPAFPVEPLEASGWAAPGGLSAPHAILSQQVEVRGGESWVCPQGGPCALQECETDGTGGVVILEAVMTRGPKELSKPAEAGPTTSAAGQVQTQPLAHPQGTVPKSQRWEVSIQGLSPPCVQELHPVPGSGGSSREVEGGQRCAQDGSGLRGSSWEGREAGIFGLS